MGLIELDVLLDNKGPLKEITMAQQHVVVAVQVGVLPALTAAWEDQLILISDVAARFT
jgi:hypothetical protein